MLRTDLLSHQTVKAAIEAVQDGDRARWSAQFEHSAELFDDGSPRSLAQLEERGDFRTYFRFHLSPSGKTRRLDIGQAE